MANEEASMHKRSRQDRAPDEPALLITRPSWQLLSGPTRAIVEDGMALMEEESASEKRRAVEPGKSVRVHAQAGPPWEMPFSLGKGFEAGAVGTQAHRMHGSVPSALSRCPTKDMQLAALQGMAQGRAGAPSVPFQLQSFPGGPAAILPAPFFMVQQPYLHAPQAGQHWPSESPTGQRRTYLDEAAVVHIFRAKHSNPGVRDLNLSGKLAREYGVTAKAVRDIWNSRTWKSVTEPYRNQYANAAQPEPEHDSPQDAEGDD